MRHQIVARGLPILLLLMGIAVILILGGAGTVGLTLGLVVVGTAAILLVSTLLHEVANTKDRYRPRQDRRYQRHHVKSR